MDEHTRLRDYDALERIPFFGPMLVDVLDVVLAVPDCLRLRGLAQADDTPSGPVTAAAPTAGFRATMAPATLPEPPPAAGFVRQPCHGRDSSGRADRRAGNLFRR